MSTTLNSTQIDTVRRSWIRDEWDSVLSKGKSHYNVARKAEFFSDPDLQAFVDYIENEYAEELDGFEQRKRGERLGAYPTPDDDVTAADAAEASRGYALYRLLRAEAWEQMVNDPGFRKVFADEEGDTLKAMRDQIRADRNFVLRRSGFASLRLKRG